MGEKDALIVDQKRLPLSQLHESVPAFAATIALSLPALILCLPLAVIGQAFGAVTRLFQPRAKIAPPENAQEFAKGVQKRASDKTGREFDLILYGATGFTGTLAAQYIAKQYGVQDFKWAIAGRRRQALEDVKEKLVSINPALRSLPIILADSEDESSIQAMVKSAKVVITTAGKAPLRP